PGADDHVMILAGGQIPAGDAILAVAFHVAAEKRTAVNDGALVVEPGPGAVRGDFHGVSGQGRNDDRVADQEALEPGAGAVVCGGAVAIVGVEEQAAIFTGRGVTDETEVLMAVGIRLGAGTQVDDA